MRRAIVVVILLAGCGRPPAAPPPDRVPFASRPESTVFIQHMKTLDRQLENLQADLGEKKPAAALKERLAKIRQSAEAAEKLPIREAAAENRDLKMQFDAFLASLARLEASDWSGEDGVRNWKALNASCNSCHSLYRHD